MATLKKENKEEWKETEIKIIQSFFPSGKDLTLKELLKKSGFSYEPVYRTLQELTKKNIIFSKKFGKTLVYNLNFKKDISKMAFNIYSIERARKFFDKHYGIYSALSEIPEDKAEMIIIFGSYAKGNPREDSDIDILCISPEFEELKSIIYTLKKSHNKDFTPVIILKKEFAKIKKENKELWHDLVNYGVIFKGYEPFYYYAYLAEEK
ncbi:MAG: nucleotidyltransferase domain-containing protein [Candidatus Pacearchaeota archaeon]|nr:nucleotidyltransferase domain-containing protein [Candidatus Pacearchaeota archaeon]